MPFIGELSALASATLWAAASIMVTYVATRIGAVSTNINRMFITSGLLLASIFLLNIPMQMTRMQVILFMISSVIGLVIGDSFLFNAFREIGPRLSMLIMSLSPAIAAIFGYFLLHESMSKGGVLGMCVTIGGIALVVLERNDPLARERLTKLGLIYALLGAFGQGVGLVFSKMAFALGTVHPFVATLIRVAAAVVILFPIALATKRYANPVILFTTKRMVLLFLLLTSFFGSYLGISLSMTAIVHTKVIGIASTLLAITPVVMLPMVKIVYKQTLSWRAIFGACLAVAGVAMLFLA